MDVKPLVSGGGFTMLASSHGALLSLTSHEGATGARMTRDVGHVCGPYCPLHFYSVTRAQGGSLDILA